VRNVSSSIHSSAAIRRQSSVADDIECQSATPMAKGPNIAVLVIVTVVISVLLTLISVH
jgi:hypothetical protein